MLLSALVFSTSAASGFLWRSREQNMSPSSHLLSENSWKLRLKTTLPLGFTFLCLSVGITVSSCLEQPPGATQALAADHGFMCPEIFSEIPHEDAVRLTKKTLKKHPKPNNPKKPIGEGFPDHYWRAEPSLHYPCSFIGYYCTYEKWVLNYFFFFFLKGGWARSSIVTAMHPLFAISKRCVNGSAKWQ